MSDLDPAETAVLGRVDVLTFTAGVGENSAAVRAAAVADLSDGLRQLSSCDVSGFVARQAEHPE